jgi:hypothetical protein
MNVFTIFLIKPTHYDDRGYPIRWHRSIIPSNTLATVNGLAEDASRRHILGDATDIRVVVLDDRNQWIDTDHVLPRRNRRLALDELVAGVLLHYRNYVSDTSGEFTSAEWTVERLAMMAPAIRPLQKNMLGRFVRTLRAFIGGVLWELRTRRQG